MIVGAAVLIILAVSATIYAKTSGQSANPAPKQATAKPATTETQPVVAEQSSSPAGANSNTTTVNKGNYPGNYRPTVTTEASPGAPPTDVSSLASLSCSLTAMDNGDKSIMLTFYAQGPAFFTVQQKISGSWQNLKENVYYMGSGGLEAASMPAAEDSISLRLLKIESGKYAAASKEFDVTRADVTAAGGLKTYPS